MAIIIAVCTSKEKGVKKEAIPEGILRENYGLVGDAHATTSSQRQVSLLATESIDRMRSSGIDLGPGDFAENLTCEGIDLVSLPVGTQLAIGKEVVLEITQIGKECHRGCAISREVGRCIMPKEGIFSRVVRGGVVKPKDEIMVLPDRLTDSTEIIPVEHITKEGRQNSEDLVTKELLLIIMLNSRELVTLICSPLDLSYLAIGFIFSAGLLKSKDEVEKITVDEQKGLVCVETGGDKGPADRSLDKQLITSGGGRVAIWGGRYPDDASGQKKMKSRFSLSAAQVLALVRQFQHKSRIFKATGGVHSAALCDQRDILVFSEDIGRHNAVDKVLGRCILENLPIANRVMLTSGRVSSEIVLKIARMNIPVLISRSAPTDLGVRLAHDLGLTLVGFAREDKMKVYTGGRRIVAGEKRKTE